MRFEDTANTMSHPQWYQQDVEQAESYWAILYDLLHVTPVTISNAHHHQTDEEPYRTKSVAQQQ